ncbi:MAG: hypothetical protein MZW92_57725 [Comamonadaceae bacterium]|nr:hypothetical protein [Comamonadaceae bacterium]
MLVAAPRAPAARGRRACRPAALARRGVHRARAGLGHARGDGGVLRRAPPRRRRVVMEMPSNETIKQAVMAGMGAELPVAAHDRPGAATAA